MNKYDVRFCRCGRVHFIEWDKLNRVCDEEDKSVLFICNNCGKTSLIWLEECMDGKAWNSISIEDDELSTKDIELIIASRGESIWMKSGGYATCKAGSTFIDWDTPKGECSDEDRKIVDVERTICMIRDEEKLEELSHYAVDIDWKGTKFEKSYHR